MQLVTPTEFARLETHLAALVDRGLDQPALRELSTALKAYVLAGGKRVRPQLCLWTFGRSKPDLAVDVVLDLACAWELFHAFLLAHDDIIDNGDVRRNQPSLHRRLASLDSGSAVFGINLAIVGGDLLFTVAMQLLHELQLPDRRYREILRLFSRVAATTGFGQAIDIMQGHAPLDSVREEELLREYHWKTAAYTFEGPMLSGALAAGVTGAPLEALSRFALALGQAYQLQNDLIDLAVPAHEGCDLVQGKRTVTLLRARAGLGEPEIRAFDDCLAVAVCGGEAGVVRAEQLRQMLLASDAPGQTAELVTSLLRTAAEAANEPALSCELRQGLGELLGELRRGYFAWKT